MVKENFTKKKIQRGTHELKKKYDQVFKLCYFNVYSIHKENTYIEP